MGKVVPLGNGEPQRRRRSTNQISRYHHSSYRREAFIRKEGVIRRTQWGKDRGIILETDLVQA